MRYHEISGGFRVPVSEEEQEIISLIQEKDQVKKADLDERQREIARLMVSRGLLNRGRDDDQVVLTLNSPDLWRN
jgi:hypothetical protein